MQKVNSPDLTILDFNVLFDISGDTPVVTFTNASTVNNPVALQWVIKLVSPSTEIYEGSFGAPDINLTSWIDPFVINTGFPRPMNSIEWSGPAYMAIVSVKDSNGNIFSETKPMNICHPAGWSKSAKNTFGKAKVEIQSRCATANLWIQDNTAATYRGIEGTQVSKNFRLVHPVDETNSPRIDTMTSGASWLFKIFSSGDYQYIYSGVFDYNLGNGITVRIKYLNKETFPVRCNIDLGPIACELGRLIDDVQKGSCSDIKTAQATIAVVTAKMQLATISILFPADGNPDPYKLIEEIKEITGWNCDCCSTGGVGQLAAISDANNITAYDVISEGGDIDGHVDIVGSTVQIKLKDSTYIFRLGAQNESSAFTITPSTNASTKIFELVVKRDIFIEEILNRIGTNTAFLNKLNSLIKVSASNSTISVNQRCLVIAGSTGLGTSTYTFVTRELEIGEKIFFQKLALSGGQGAAINFLFDGTNLNDLKSALDSLPYGLGIWNVDYTANVLTLSIVTDKGLDDMRAHYSTEDAQVDDVLTKTKSNTQRQNYKTEDVIQSLIDFVCGNIINNLKVGAPLSILSLQAIGTAASTINIGSNDLMTTYLTKFTGAYNQLVNLVKNITQPSCDSMHGLFSIEDTDGIEDSDRALFFMGNNCRVVSVKSIAAKVFDLAKKDAEIKSAICEATNACKVAVCPIVAGLTASYNNGTNVLSLEITAPVNSQGLRYRVSYRLAGSRLGLRPTTIQDSGNPTTTFQWTGVDPNAYEVVVETICQDNSISSPVTATTAACNTPGIFNASIDGANFKIDFGNMPGNADRIIVDIRYPNGGRFTQDYPLAPTSINIPIPAGVDGDFVITGRSSCNLASGWMSAPTPQIILNITEASSCPPVTKVAFSSITKNSVTIVATKPVSVVSPNAFTLRLTPQNGGVATTYTQNSAGSTVQWDITGLTPNTVYFAEIISNCSTGNGDPYNGGSFTTSTSGSAEAILSTVTNNAPADATSVSISINDSLIEVVSPLAVGQLDEFNVTNYLNVQVKVTPCNAGATSAQITSGATTYNHSFVKGQTFVFDNVTIVGNQMFVTFS